MTLGSMVPSMWLSLRRGIRIGVVAGAVFGVLALFIDVLLLGASAVVATPVQAILEYPVAFGLIGLTGLFHKKTVPAAIAGAALSVFFRFLVHYFAGVFVWYYVYAFPPRMGAVGLASSLQRELSHSGIHNQWDNPRNSRQKGNPRLSSLTIRKNEKWENSLLKNSANY